MTLLILVCIQCTKNKLILKLLAQVESVVKHIKGQSLQPVLATLELDSCTEVTCSAPLINTERLSLNLEEIMKLSRLQV